MTNLTLWLLCGMGLLIAEMLTGTFVLIFISLGCFAAALVSGISDDQLALQILVCAVISLVGMFLLRKPLQRKMMKSAKVEADIGREILIDQTIPPHAQVRISYQGTTWQATNLGTEALQQGDRVTIVGIDGTILLLRKID